MFYFVRNHLSSTIFSYYWRVIWGALHLVTILRHSTALTLTCLNAMVKEVYVTNKTKSSEIKKITSRTFVLIDWHLQEFTYTKKATNRTIVFILILLREPSILV